MLIIKKQLLEIGNSHKDLFINLHLDTHKTGYISGWERSLNGELINSKPWIGNVETNKKQFKISWTRTGILRSNISTITGHEVNDGVTIKLKLKYGFSWLAVFTIVASCSFLSVVAISFLDDIWGWLIAISIWAFQVLSIMLELNKTEERFIQYLDSR